jgi:hypothetical protein
MTRLPENRSSLVSNSRWLAYAAAGAASTLGGAHSAEAEIHYSGEINARFGDGHRVLNIVVPLRHSARLHFTSGTYELFFAIDGAAVSNRFCGYEFSRGTGFPSRLSQGVVISNCRFLSGGGSMVRFSPFTAGAFFEEGLGFIGFSFNNGAGPQYGWARVRTPGPPYFRARFLLVDYAWGDPGDQVRTGQTSLADDQGETGCASVGDLRFDETQSFRAPRIVASTIVRKISRRTPAAKVCWRYGKTGTENVSQSFKPGSESTKW